MPEPLLILSSVGENFDAPALARTLVEKRLAACVNIVGHTQSVYRWEETIEKAHEQLLLIKTTDERLPELRETLLAMHPYEVPELVVIEPRDVSDAYRAWLLRAVAR